MSKKLNNSFKQIRNALELAQKKQISAKGTKKKEEKSNGFSTIENYMSQIKAMGNRIYEKYGVADYRKWKPEWFEEQIRERMDKYHDENDLSQAHNVNGMISAIQSYNNAVQNIPSLQKKHKPLMDTKKMREEKNEKNIVRYSAASTTLRATNEISKKVLENIKTNGYQTEKREVAFHIAKIEFLTGGRITNIYKMKSEHIKIDGDKIEIYFEKDKGGKSRTVKIDDKETADYLSALKEQRGEEGRLFALKRKNGTFLSAEESRKQISRIISDAGKEFSQTKTITVKDKNGKPKEVEVEQKFSSHSFRKNFAMNRCEDFLEKFSSEHQRKKYFSDLIKEDPVVKEKIDTLYERINEKRNNPREISPLEYAVLAASIDLGHYRNDVIVQYYADYEKLKKIYEDEHLS